MLMLCVLCGLMLTHCILLFVLIFAVTYSSPQMLDCVHTATTNGCNGGTPMDAIDYISQPNIQVATQQSYPMKIGGGTGPCQNTMPNMMAPHLRGYGWVMAATACADSNPSCAKQNAQEVAMLQHLKDQPQIPIIAYVHASDAWVNHWNHLDPSQPNGAYVPGVFDPSLCSSGVQDGNHVVELMSVVPDPNGSGVLVWQARNSWGNLWGNDGSIYLPFGVNACGLANFAILPGMPPPSATAGDQNSLASMTAAMTAQMTQYLQGGN